MILTIPKLERAIFEKTCAEFEMNCRFYTNEINEDLIAVDITVTYTFGTDDPSPRMMFHFGRAVQINWENEMQKTYKQ